MSPALQTLNNYLFFFLGIAFFETVYIAYHYILFQRKEFIGYFFFVVMVSFFLILEAMGQDFIPQFSHWDPRRFHLSHVPVILLASSGYMYFIRHVSNASEHDTRMNRACQWTERLAIGTAVVSLPLILLNEGLTIVKAIFVPIYAIMLPAQLFILYRLAKRSTIYSYFVVAGSITLMVFLRISFFTWIFTGTGSYENLRYLLIVIAFVSNFICINLALQFRSKEIQDEKLKLEVERQDELNQQRVMISKDLHDDAGASLSSLLLYAGMAEQSAERDPQMTRFQLKRLSEGLRQVMENMNDIVWALNRDEQN